MHSKMDVRNNIKSAMTPQRALREGIIKRSEELSNREVLGIIDQVIIGQSQWIGGETIALSLYSCL